MHIQHEKFIADLLNKVVFRFVPCYGGHKKLLEAVVCEKRYFLLHITIYVRNRAMELPAGVTISKRFEILPSGAVREYL